MLDKIHLFVSLFIENLVIFFIGSLFIIAPIALLLYIMVLTHNVRFKDIKSDIKYWFKTIKYKIKK